MDNYVRRAALVRVIDGDTQEFRVDLGMKITRRETIRLADIDVAERYTALGAKATLFVKDELTNADEIYLQTIKDKDEWGKYGRYLARVIYKKDEEEFDLSDRLRDEGFEKEVS